MKYYEVTFTISPCTQDAKDLLSALAGEAGFETFEEIPDGLVGYVQQALFDQATLESVLETFPFENTHIIYKVCEAEDRDWNEQWEQEGFDPIIVQGQRTIVIHDGRHLPSSITYQATPDTNTPSPITIEIDAHMAFGTGTHQTTRMVCAAMTDLFLPQSVVEGGTIERNPRRVLDCGSGTGILGICALKLGAESCTAYDIDEWSVDNTRHNAVINHVDDRLRALHGDATLLNPKNQSVPNNPDFITNRFDLVVANINRNILLADMERFVSVMNSGATLIISGFYQNDCPFLESKAQSLGLTIHHTLHDDDWACMVLNY